MGLKMHLEKTAPIYRAAFVSEGRARGKLLPKVGNNHGINHDGSSKEVIVATVIDNTSSPTCVLVVISSLNDSILLRKNQRFVTIQLSPGCILEER
jgi:hypothetical protein